MEIAKVTSKGQITIPVSIRRRLQINEGDKLLFIDRPDGVMMVNPDLLGSGEDIDTYAETSINEGTQKAAAATSKQSSKSSAAHKSKELYNDAGKPSVSTPKPSVSSSAKVAKVGDLNLDSLLDEIRSIGSKV